MDLLSSDEFSTQKIVRILRVAHLRPHLDDSWTSLMRELGGDRLAHVFVFAQARADLERVITRLSTEIPDTNVTGCTTAGQIGQQGYTDEDVVVVALPACHFATQSVLIEGLDRIDPQALIDRLVQTRSDLSLAHPDKPNGFAFLLVDGLSLREDALTAAIAPAMGPWPVFGGSAGDGARFHQTHIAHNGQLYRNAAVLTFAATNCDTHVFSLNHLDPTQHRMVVTGADPEQRIVKEINAEPAAREYARIVGKDPDQLDEFTFAAHPVVVRLGDTHHVRAIQRVNEKGELVFFAAIDEGMVLSVATPQDLPAHLEQQLSKVAGSTRSADILACDCILRRIEAEQSQSLHKVSDVLARHHVVGFSTYGEQIGPMHVNHTMTGVALTRPGH